MKTIVAIAPNGARRTAADHPALPVTPAAIAREAAASREAGASVIHLHVRDGEGRHSLDPGLYREATDALRQAVGGGLVVQMTTEAVGAYEPEAQMAAVRAVRPEAVSLALRELAPGPGDVPAFARFLDWLRAERIAPQVILYDRADVERLTGLARAGTIDPASVSVLFVLGRYAPPTTAEPADLLRIVSPHEWPFRDWMVCAFGGRELACVLTAALLGGHARVGFENNLLRPDGRPAASTAENVGHTVRALHAAGLAVASAEDARALWGIGD